MSPKNMYYIYFHKNPITLEVFYVGIGSNKRAWRFKERNTHWLRYVKKHGFPVVEIIKENLTKEEAGLLEIEYIQQFGRKGYDIEGKLVNISLGGKGGTNPDVCQKFCLGVQPCFFSCCIFSCGPMRCKANILFLCSLSSGLISVAGKISLIHCVL